jgi:hypothetical protein
MNNKGAVAGIMKLASTAVLFGHSFAVTVDRLNITFQLLMPATRKSVMHIISSLVYTCASHCV